MNGLTEMEAVMGGAVNSSKSGYLQVFSRYNQGLNTWFYYKERVKVSSEFYTIQ